MLKKLFKESRTEKRGSVKIFTPPQKFWYATDEQAKFMAKAEEKHLKKDKNPIEFTLKFNKLLVLVEFFLLK